MNRASLTVVASAVALVAAACANAQQTSLGQPSSGLVSVELTQVSANIAERLKVDEAKMPMSIQVPPNVAAEVCGVTPGAPSAQVARSGDGCMARKSSPALDQLITSRMKADDPATMGGSPGDRK
jgi:hypothetical protein